SGTRMATTVSVSLCLFRMVFLDGLHIQALAADSANTVNSGGCARNGCDAGHSMIDCRAANRFFIEERLTAQWRIDDEMDFSALDVIHNMRSSLVHLVNRLNIDSGISENPGRSTRCDDLEADLHKISRNSCNKVLVVLVDANERHAGFRQDGTGADLGLNV